MKPTTPDQTRPHPGVQTALDDHLACRAERRLRPLTDLPRLEQQRAVQRLATAEGWDFWLLGGFRFRDGSVLRHEASGWQAISPQDARERLHAERTRPLDVLVLHAFTGSDGRGKRSISQARFEFQTKDELWHLDVQYEAFMDSPLYGFRADRFAALLGLDLLALRLDTPQLSQRWRLEQIALHPDWLELLTVSSAPDLSHLQAMNGREPASLETG